MNLEKLKDVETEFLLQYPKGFEDAVFFPTMKKFDPSKLEAFTKENLKKEFENMPQTFKLDTILKNIYDLEGKIELKEKELKKLKEKLDIIAKEKNSGEGTKLMKDICEYADKTKKIIILSPSDEFGGNKKRLIEFYKRFGFVENKGKNKDFEIFESMYRLPK